jgi:hypothetical protein
MTQKFRTTAGFLAVIAGALLVVGDLGLLLGYLRGSGSFVPELTETSLYALASFVGTPLFTATALITLVAVGLALLAVVGLHSQQAEQTGQLGLFCVAALVIGLAFTFAVAWFVAFLLPDLVALSPEVFSGASSLVAVGLIVADIALIAGTLGYFVITWDAGVYPSWTGMFLALSGMLGLASFFVDVPVGEAAALGIALIGMGMYVPKMIGPTSSGLDLDDIEPSPASGAPDGPMPPDTPDDLP